MTIHEAIRSQWEIVKDRPLREKLSYFWSYYGAATICIILVLAGLISLVVTVATKKDPAFSGAFFGAIAGDNAESFLSDFAQSAGIDTEEYTYSVQVYPDIRMDQVLTEDAYYSTQSFAALVAAKSVEVFSANRELFVHYCYMGYGMDLRKVFSPQELEVLAPHLLYIDAELVKKMENAAFGEDVTGGSYPDPTDPKAMESPMPVGIDLSISTEAFRSNYRFGETAAIGICANTPHADYAAAFLRYIFALS